MSRKPEILPSEIMKTGGELHRSIDESISILSSIMGYDGAKETPETLSGLKTLVDKLHAVEQRIRSQLDVSNRTVAWTVPLDRVNKCQTILTLLKSVVSQSPPTARTQSETSDLLDALSRSVPELKEGLMEYGYVTDGQLDEKSTAVVFTENVQEEPGESYDVGTPEIMSALAQLAIGEIPTETNPYVSYGSLSGKAKAYVSDDIPFLLAQGVPLGYVISVNDTMEIIPYHPIKDTPEVMALKDLPPIKLKEILLSMCDYPRRTTGSESISSIYPTIVPDNGLYSIYTTSVTHTGHTQTVIVRGYPDNTQRSFFRTVITAPDHSTRSISDFTLMRHLVP